MLSPEIVYWEVTYGRKQIFGFIGRFPSKAHVALHTLQGFGHDEIKRCENESCIFLWRRFFRWWEWDFPIAYFVGYCWKYVIIVLDCQIVQKVVDFWKLLFWIWGKIFVSGNLSTGRNIEWILRGIVPLREHIARLFFLLCWRPFLRTNYDVASWEFWGRIAVAVGLVPFF